MPKPKVLSGDDCIRIFKSFGFEPVKQKGSHIKLRRVFEGKKQILTVPKHREIDRGTLMAIYRQATRLIPEKDLHKHFFS